MVEVLGWVASGFILFGYYLNANKKQISWITWFVGNILMMIYSIEIDAWPQVALAIALMVLNIYGWINWLEDEGK